MTGTTPAPIQFFLGSGDEGDEDGPLPVPPALITAERSSFASVTAERGS